jgi:hypothetical protein
MAFGTVTEPVTELATLVPEDGADDGINDPTEGIVVRDETEVPLPEAVMIERRVLRDLLNNDCLRGRRIG